MKIIKKVKKIIKKINDIRTIKGWKIGIKTKLPSRTPEDKTFFHIKKKEEGIDK